MEHKGPFHTGGGAGATSPSPQKAHKTPLHTSGTICCVPGPEAGAPRRCQGRNLEVPGASLHLPDSNPSICVVSGFSKGGSSAKTRGELKGNKHVNRLEGEQITFHILKWSGEKNSVSTVTRGYQTNSTRQPVQPFTRLPLHGTRVLAQTAAIIHPHNRGHFHEKGGRGESERGGPGICRAMWLPRRERGTGSPGGREKSTVSLLCLLPNISLVVFFRTELNCSFVSGENRREVFPRRSGDAARKSPSGPTGRSHQHQVIEV